MAYGTEEKRRFPRVPIKATLNCRFRGTPEFDNAVSEDISLGGISFVHKGFIAPQTPVSLKINLFSRVLNPIGRIAWSWPLPHSDKYKVGVEFLELDYSEKKLLSNFMNLQAA
jgi:c-di-GMP-binding flagellar brake protein YcgR